MSVPAAMLPDGAKVIAGPRMTREEFSAAVDWQRVRADVLEARAELETRISQRTAELRSACSPVSLADQERFAAWQ